MADVQLHHGHVRSANALWEAWSRADTTAAELRVLMAVVRLSYGWGRKTTATQHAPGCPPPASTTQVQRMTGLDPKSVRRGFRGLVMKQMLRRVRAGDARTNQPAVYAPEKDFDLWSPGVLPGTWEPLPDLGADFPQATGSVPPPPAGSVPVGPGGSVPPHKNKGEQEEIEEEERAQVQDPYRPAPGALLAGLTTEPATAARVDELRAQLGDSLSYRPKNAPKWTAIASLDDTATVDKILAWSKERARPVDSFLNQFNDGQPLPKWLEEKPSRSKAGPRAANAPHPADNAYRRSQLKSEPVPDVAVRVLGHTQESWDMVPMQYREDMVRDAEKREAAGVR